MLTNETTAVQGFNRLGIAISIIKVLDKLQLREPTPIQFKSIPAAIEGKDLIGIAQTGTGKTFAFGIPMLQRIALYKGLGLVVLPTRELALQVEENLQKIGGSLGLRTASLIGGEPIGKQIANLKKKPHIIVATPGRLIDHIKRRLVRLDRVKILVLDEADMMFDMGFAPQIEEIIAHIPKDRQTMLFSATMPPEIIKLAARHMALPVRVETAPQGTTADNIDQEILIMKKEEKLKHLEKILREHKGSVLIFCRTKHGVKNLARAASLMGHATAEIHSNRTLAQRREALAGFKAGKYRILAATDIAARGIDVSGIELVVNYDLPEKPIDYVHRIGRTARAGSSGKAISFAITSQGKEIKSIERLINMSVPQTRFAKLIQPPARSFKPRNYGYGSVRPGTAASKFRPAGFSAGKTREKEKYSAEPERHRGPERKMHTIAGRSLTDKQRFQAQLKSIKR